MLFVIIRILFVSALNDDWRLAMLSHGNMIFNYFSLSRFSPIRHLILIFYPDIIHILRLCENVMKVLLTFLPRQHFQVEKIVCRQCSGHSHAQYCWEKMPIYITGSYIPKDRACKSYSNLTSLLCSFWYWVLFFFSIPILEVSSQLGGKWGIGIKKRNFTQEFFCPFNFRFDYLIMQIEVNAA